MAYNANEMVGSVTTQGASIRMWAETVQPKTIAAVFGAPLLARGTPVAYNTSTGYWNLWAAAGSNGTNAIGGFVYEPVQTSATEQQIFHVMLEGRIHYADIVLPSGEIDADLTTACLSGPRDLGLIIEGLAHVH
jgi:hypothetical protein